MLTPKRTAGRPKGSTPVHNVSLRLNIPTHLRIAAIAAAEGVSWSRACMIVISAGINAIERHNDA